MDALADHVGTISIGGRTITNIWFADDIVGLAGEEKDPGSLVQRHHLMSLRNGNQCRKNKIDNQQHQWHGTTQAHME